MALLNNFETRIWTPPLPFHLSYSLQCGQTFGWKKFRGGFLGFIGNSPVSLEEAKGKILATGKAEALEAVPRFFRWDDNLRVIADRWKEDRILQEAFQAFPGLRLLRQEPWGCLLSFLLSILSNIPKIETSLEKLCRHAGEPVSFLGRKLHRMPTPEAVSRIPEKTLRRFGMGFRARYLRHSAERIAGGFPLSNLRTLPYSESKKNLLGLFGVGEKVADCILLFGLGHLEAFPVDVWMQRILQAFYFRGKEKSTRYLADWGRERFGPHAGYAQQYLYTYGRAKLNSATSPFRIKKPSPRGREAS